MAKPNKNSKSSKTSTPPDSRTSSRDRSMHSSTVSSPKNPNHPKIDLDKLESGTTLTTTTSSLEIPYSPRNDLQLGGYPPDCGTKEHKYLSYAKVLHERGKTHPMSFSTTKVDAVGNPVPESYPLNIDFGAHSFHRLPTDSFVLSQYGVGMTLYFKYLKVMAWLFFILVILSTPSMLIYIVGGAESFEEFTMLAKQNFPLIFGMTTIGHLKASSSTCDQVVQGNQVSLACPAGEIGFIKAIYSPHASQGSCSCPQVNKVADGNGQCRGKPIVTCKGGANCTRTCPSDGYGCFQGLHPISKWTCCASALDPVTQEPDFSDMRIRSTPGCRSETIQTIANGLCLGKKTCSFMVDENLRYRWKVNTEYGTICANETRPNEICEATIMDQADFSKCPMDDPNRGVILYARCFTTRIDLSKEWSLKIIGWDSISRKDFLGIAVGCDIVCSLWFFFILLWMKRKEKENVVRMSKDQIKVMDYTVQLMQLPPHTDLQLLREEIRLHLEKLLTKAPRFAKDFTHIRIADIQFGKRTCGHLEILRERGHIIRQLEVAQQRLEKVKLLESRFYAWTFRYKIQTYEKRIEKLQAKIEQKNQRLARWNEWNQRRSPSQAVTAFITFEEEEGVHRCLNEYPDYGFLYRFFQPHAKRLHGKRLRFRPAPDPTDIVWENLRHPYWERLLRQGFVAFVTLAVLFISFLLILVAKLQKTRLEREFGRPTSCPVSVTKEQVVEDEIQKTIGIVPYKAMIECYCKNVLLHKSFKDMTQEIFYNPTTQTNELYCKTWSTSFLTTQAFSILSVLMVVIVNLLLARILNTLVTLEKNHTETAQVVSRVTKVFLAQVFNTALLMIIINANLNYFFEEKSFTLNQLPILSGKYSDFTPEWYNDVGVALILTMIINTISPHIYVVMEYLHQQLTRWRDRSYSFDFTLTKQDTQRDLEHLYRGPRFDLASRYAQSLTSIFITYMFSAGMPFLHVVGFMEMMMTYWADKFTFLRITRSPPLYDAKVATATGSLLPYAVIVHSMIAMWMFSNELIFQTPNDIIKQLSNDKIELVGEGIPSFEVEKGQLFGRVTRPQVVVLFGFFVAFGVIVILRVLLFEYFPSFLSSFCPALARVTQRTNMAKGIPNYFDAIPTSTLRDKVVAPYVKDSLRAKYITALEKREAALRDPDSPRRSPKRRNKRTLSAAEHYNEERWIVGCPSYAIGDNKEYVDELAIDSYVSGGIQLDQIL